MQKANHQILELIKNEHFVQWIVTPSEESTHYWSKWMLTHPDRKKDVEIARQIILSAQYSKDYKMPEEDYNLVLENIVNYSQKKGNKEIQWNPNYWKMAGIAAAVVLVLLAGFMAMRFNVSKNIRHEVASSEMITKTTLKGQKMVVQLPDGSKVMLNAESELTYSTHFKTKRSVTLKGEAFFEVTKDKNSPFTVHSGDIMTKVLGTSFNVRSYPEDTENSIAVVTGKVEVSDKQGNQALLVPNVRGVFTLEDNQLLIEPFSVNKEIGWKDGVIHFEDTPLPQVIATLERWYGVSFIVKDRSLLFGKYTGTYKNASLEKVMKGVSYTTGFEFSLQEKEVTIY
ncbi:DUF4974 domain-containing protein [Fulvivirga sp. M361]|uniref:FecR family protein n=1 Tax=Fulvivirga sp. M361 TaxID=2594266 RepID=UPI00117ADF6F|nr:FecR family protein [Fulvivirga sp. M361]TRX60149.1 DUF4974 domain-containing protein [Fulvivirga sp. M361]